MALAVQRLVPAGGLELHALRLAALLKDRGCAVTIFTTRPPAAAPEGVTVRLMSPRGRTNHGRLATFAADAARAASGRFDRTVAFHAVPGFDTVFCADPSRADPRPPARWLPRYRAFAALERAAFAPESGARVLCLAEPQRDAFLKAHGGPPERFVLLAPTMERPAAGLDGFGDAETRAARSQLDLPADGPVWLWMGLAPRTKGLDRALRALATVPGARLVICGPDPNSRATRGTAGLARRLGVGGRMRWLGFVRGGDRLRAMAAADLLVHPSRADVTGGVILEAMTHGLPVVCTALCGFAPHVGRSGAGLVLPDPFRPADLERALESATPARCAAWSKQALAYARREDLFGGLEQAADLILEAPPAVARRARMA